jgi:hypothetical protein
MRKQASENRSRRGMQPRRNRHRPRVSPALARPPTAPGYPASALAAHPGSIGEAAWGRSLARREEHARRPRLQASAASSLHGGASQGPTPLAASALFVRMATACATPATILTCQGSATACVPNTATSSQVTPGWLLRPSAVLAVAGARLALISDAILEGCETLPTKIDEGGTDGSTG